MWKFVILLFHLTIVSSIPSSHILVNSTLSAPRVYFGFYNTDLTKTASASTLYLAASLQDALNVYQQYKIPSLLDTSKTLLNWGPRPIVLFPDWQSRWQNLVQQTQPHIASGTLIGFNLGDELLLHCLQPRHIDAMAQAIRASFPNTIIWYNEGHKPIEEHLNACGTKVTFSISSALSWFSIDLYHHDGVVPNWVHDNVKAFYKKYIFPNLHPGQRIALVPGSFNSNLNPNCDTKCYDEMIGHDAVDFIDWALSDSRVAAVIPWNWNGCPGFDPCIHNKDELSTDTLPTAPQKWFDLAAKLR